MDGTLHVLKLGQRGNKNHWIEPQTNGKGPCHRYQHCMVTLKDKNLLIIQGGRTSQNIKDYSEKKLDSFMKPITSIKKQVDNNKRISQSSFTLSDMWALKLDSLEWIKILIQDEAKIARTNHCLAKIGEDSLIMFGGNGNNSLYCNTDYLIMLNTRRQTKGLNQ